MMKLLPRIQRGSGVASVIDAVYLGSQGLLSRAKCAAASWSSRRATYAVITTVRLNMTSDAPAARLRRPPIEEEGLFRWCKAIHPDRRSVRATSPTIERPKSLLRSYTLFTESDANAWRAGCWPVIQQLDMSRRISLTKPSWMSSTLCESPTSKFARALKALLRPWFVATSTPGCVDPQLNFGQTLALRSGKRMPKVAPNPNPLMTRADFIRKPCVSCPRWRKPFASSGSANNSVSRKSVKSFRCPSIPLSRTWIVRGKSCASAFPANPGCFLFAPFSDALEGVGLYDSCKARTEDRYHWGSQNPLSYGRGSVGGAASVNASYVALAFSADDSSRRCDDRLLARRTFAAPSILPSPISRLSRTCIPHPACFAWVYGHDHVGRGPVP